MTVNSDRKPANESRSDRDGFLTSWKPRRLVAGFLSIYYLLLGLWTTFKHLFKPAITVQYPDQKRQPYPAWRGNIKLIKERCTSCMICANYCPNYCISIKYDVGEDKKRKLKNYTVDMGICMYCGICVEVCPFSALVWNQDYERSVYDRKQLIERKDA